MINVNNKKVSDTMSNTTKSRFATDTSGLSAKQKAMAAYDDETPSSFRKEVMYESEGVTISEKLTIRKNAAVHAMDMAGLQDDGFEAKRWRKLAWELKSTRI